jgi:hypothetical protein
MPAEVLLPESFVPCAIAGEKFTAVSKATVAAASNRVFILALRMCQREFEPSAPGCDDPADSGISFDAVSRSTAVTLSGKFKGATLDGKT